MPLSKAPLQLSRRPLQVLAGCSKVSLEPSLLQAEQPQLSQPGFTGELFQPLDHFCGLLWTCSNRSGSVLCWGVQSWTQDFRWGVSTVQLRGRIPSLALLTTLLGMQPRTLLACWAASTRCWATLSFLSTSTPSPSLGYVNSSRQIMKLVHVEKTFLGINNFQ